MVQINLITLEAYYHQFIYFFRWWDWCVDQVKRYVWRINMFEPVQPFWIVTRKFCRKSYFTTLNQSKVHFNQSNALFHRLNSNRITIEPSRDSRIIFLPFSNNRARASTDQKCYISNFHLKNFTTWIFTITTLWNNIFQTQKSLLQLIHVYTYIYNTQWAVCTTITEALIGIIKSHFGCHFCIFSISSIESKVVKFTPTLSAYLMWDSALQQLTNMIRSGETPCDKIDSILAWLAQPKFDPRAAMAPIQVLWFLC